MKEYVLYPHGGSGNHGCEAIVRTTCKMLEHKKTILFSTRTDEDYRYGINALDALNFSPVISRLNQEAVLVSIGGDNYCYGENEFIYMVNRYAKVHNSRTVLWGCSVEPDAISEQMAADLKSYDLIVARESISYDMLKKINKNTVLKPDPAFTMFPTKCQLPSVFHQSKVIGINLSPLIIRSEKIPGVTIRNYIKLIQFILSDTSYSVALIPHVVWQTNDDRTILNQLKSEFSDTDRVVLVEDHTAPELKYIISHCELFVGARTHATIAAYSTEVPTLVVGYSVKAKGIAKDIFGSFEKYVLPVQNLMDDNDLRNAFQYIVDNKKTIKEHLHNTMPKYIQSAYDAGRLLTEGLS